MVKLSLLVYPRLFRYVALEEGQDLVEYALVVALIAFGATAGMSTLASSINNAFSSLSGALTIA